MGKFYDGADEETLARMAEQQKEIGRLAAEVTKLEMLNALLRSDKNLLRRKEENYETAIGVLNNHEYCPHCDQHFDAEHDKECPVWAVTGDSGSPKQADLMSAATETAMSEMIDKAAAALPRAVPVMKKVCPKCEQRGWLECEHISPTDFAAMLAAAEENKQVQSDE